MIARLSDADFGFTDLEEKPDRTRYATRILLFNDEGEICVVKSGKRGYLQLPGGGIEDGETIEEGLRRETVEETGYEIYDISPLGMTVEDRRGVRNNNAQKRVSYAFTAKPGKNVGTNYMEDEIEEGFEPVWLPIEEVARHFRESVGKIESYSGNFSNMRDLLIIEDWQKQKN